MNTKTYDRVMNACVAWGVLSALLFEHAGSFKPAVGGLGVIAGAVAVTVYFRNRWASDSSRPTRDETLESRPTEVALNKALITEPPQDNVNPSCVTYAWAHGGADYYAATGNIIGDPNQLGALWHATVMRTTYNPIVVIQPCDFVEHVVRIVRRLSEQEGPPFEFILAQDGSLTIRPSRENKTSSITKGGIATFEQGLDWEEQPTGKPN